MNEYEDVFKILNSQVKSMNSLVTARKEISKLPTYTSLLVEFDAIPCANQSKGTKQTNYGLLRSPQPEPHHLDVIEYKIIGANSEVKAYFDMLESFGESTQFKGILFEYVDTKLSQFTPYYVGSPGFTFYEANQKQLEYLAKKFSTVKGKTELIDLDQLVWFGKSY